ncbi:RNA-directed DNA polymerase, partial [Escherichia coli]|nr:RNA-directed DNA polymerase [Escherichia coli]
RLENALDRVDPNKDYSGKIKKLLQTFSETKSYGVPVGCPASRILAELALDSIDKLLSMNRINYKRYVDDFVIFCNSREDAHKILTLLSKKLM